MKRIPAMAPASPGPLPEPPDLDERILAAERAVIERDGRVQARVELLVARGERALDRARSGVGRLVGVGAAVGAGALLAARLAPAWRPARLAAAVRGEVGRRASPAPRRDPRWASLLALAWPFMPLRLRTGVNPRLAALVLSLGLPLLSRPRAPAAGVVRSAPHVDLQRYAGRWYEIARFPERHEKRCAGEASALYALEAGGEALAIVNRCRTPEGHWDAVAGRGLVVPRSNGSQLEVSFAPRWLRWLPRAWADTWILRVDDDYRCALVGTPDRRHLWLLSRTPRLAGAEWQRLVEHAQAQGYDAARLVRTPQSPGR